MKICVAGLGLIGGSLCMALSRAGYAADGWNRSAEPLAYALENGIIRKKAESFEGYDVVFVALPPRAALNFINSHAFKKGAVVADICGVKGFIEREILFPPKELFLRGHAPYGGQRGIHRAQRLRRPVR